jgi:hypothetical protein
VDGGRWFDDVNVQQLGRRQGWLIAAAERAGGLLALPARGENVPVVLDGVVSDSVRPWKRRAMSAHLLP